MVHATSSSRHTGGVSTYVREDIEFAELDIASKDRMWWLCGVKIKSEKGIFYIYTVYRSPSYSVKDFLIFFENWLQDHIKNSHKVIIVGDFNINLNVDSKEKRQILDMTKGFGLRQIVNFDTRISKTSTSCIDFVFSNAPRIKASRLKKLKIGDHESIKIHCDLFNPLISKQKEKIINDWKKMDYEALNGMLNKVRFSHEMDVNTKAALLCSEIESAVTALLPQKIIRPTRRVNERPWYTRELEALQGERDDARESAYTAPADKKDALWKLYTKNRNRYTQMCRKTEQNYYHSKIDCNRGDGKVMWKTLKSIVDEQSQRNTQLTLKFNDGSTIEDYLNEFYVQSIEKIVQSIPSVNDSNKTCLKEINQIEECFSFKQISSQELVNIIKSLKSTAVPDNINLNVILKAFDKIEHLLLNVINSVITEGKYPDLWKISKISPIPKVKNPKEAQDLRPINILPLCEKVLEIVLHKQMSEYIKEKNILCEMQSGFRKNHSCESAIQIVLAKWRRLIEEGNVVIAVFLDFKRAFETIDRDLLITKLKKYGFSADSLKLLKSFLSDRKQYVYVNGQKSKCIDVNIGVPQGSVLGPLLFILYINDLPENLKDVLVKIFADDTLISAFGKTYKEAASKINSKLQITNTWLEKNKVKLNAEKSKCMVLTKSKRSFTALQPDIIRFPIVINETNLEIVHIMKYLGVMIDSNLKFNDHVSYVIKKAGTKINYLCRISKKLSKKTKILLYNCIISPHFDYCASVLWQTKDENVRQLQLLQNRAMRAILNCKRKTHIEDMLKNLKWLNIEDRIKLNMCVLIKKILNGEMPTYLTENVQYINNVHSHDTRSKNNLYISPVKSSFCDKSLFQSGFQTYNEIPFEIKSIKKTKLFKNAYLYYLRDGDMPPLNNSG
jgi:Reverse transcriptase (RNA-dependent DNA polymerase)/Endonuclease-reverse transcriptase